MRVKVYMCENTGVISETELTKLPYSVPTSQFCIVIIYEKLYQKEQLRFKEEIPTPYGLPGTDKREYIYNGIDREPLDFTPDDFCEYSEEDARLYFDLLEQKDQTELIFIKIYGSDDAVPEGLSFLGYDVAYPFGYGYGDGFSAICDCLFLCRWHGCDKEGTEFISEFSKLNENGLFDSSSDAYKYLVHYLNQDWSERGDFCIYEIYR